MEAVLTITPLQSRMARAALDLSVRDLARLAGLSPAMVSRFENGQPASPGRLARLRGVLEAAGIILVAEDDAEGAGLRLAKTFRRGFVYDADGKQVASIVGHAVIDVARHQRIATARGDDLYTLAGESLGALRTVDVFQHAGSLPAPGLRLLMDAEPGPALEPPLGPLDLVLDADAPEPPDAQDSSDSPLSIRASSIAAL